MIPTPWGDIEVADAHVHFFSPAFFETLNQQTKVTDVGALLNWDTPGSVEDLANRWEAELDRHGVDKAALIASITGDSASVQAAVALHPERFFGYFMVNPAAPGAEMRVSGALAQGNLHAICLFPAMHRYSLHDERTKAVLQIAAAHPGTIVFVHCGALSVGFRNKLGLPSLFDLRYSNPIDLHAIALEFPNVNFVIPHFGAGYFREALMVCDLCPNIYLDSSSSNRWRRYEAADLDLAKVFEKALEVAGPRRILFGSDSSYFPRGWVRKVFDDQTGALRTVGIDVETARLIFGGNLKRMLSC